jgi:hypothetical protein
VSTNAGLGLVAPAWASRVASGAVALGCGAVLVLASLLVPSPSGHGTHMQLGLGNCTFLAWTGHPCPMCGATTTFTLLAHFHPVMAFVNQPFASLLFVITCVLFAVGLAEAVDPRDRWSRIANLFARYEATAAVAFLVLMLSSWLYELATWKG